MFTWISAGKGIRYREHTIRKHGKKPDRYWCIQYKLQEKNINEAVGWWSDGVTQGQCEELLSTLRINQKNAQGPQTLKEMRQDNLRRRADEAATERANQQNNRTVAGYWESEYLPNARLTMAGRSLTSHSCLMRKWLAPLSLRQINSITPVDLENHIIKPMLEDGRSPVYVEKTLRFFSALWNHAKEAGFTSGDNPVSKIKIPKKDSRRHRFLNKDEAARLLAYLSDHYPEVHDVAIMSLFSGLRIGECLDLTWADINFDDDTIFVKDTKTTRNRHAYISAEIKAMLNRRNTGQTKSARGFPSPVSGNGYHTVWQKFNKSVKALGLNEGIDDSRQMAVIHTLRHTFASWLVQLGTPLYTVSQLMGHSDLKMTERYAHLAPDTQRAAALDLEGILG